MTAVDDTGSPRVTAVEDTGNDHPGDSEDEPIDVQISVRPECSCFPQDRDWSSVKQSFTQQADGSRSCRMATAGDSTSEYQDYEVNETCPCEIFAQHDCVVDFDEIRDGRMIFSLTLPDRSKLPSIVADLREAEAAVSVERILTVGETDDCPPVLTDKQCEALSLAIESGYYDRPRGTTLDELAETLDITPSAVSQRLNAVNRRLIEKYCQQFDPELVP